MEDDMAKHYNLGITNPNYRANMRGEEFTNTMCDCGCGKTTARCEIDKRIAELSEQRRQEQQRQADEIANDAAWLDEVTEQMADDADLHVTQDNARF